MSDSSRQSTDCCWCYPYNNSIILNEKKRRKFTKLNMSTVYWWKHNRSSLIAVPRCAQHHGSCHATVEGFGKPPPTCLLWIYPPVSSNVACWKINHFFTGFPIAMFGCWRVFYFILGTNLNQIVKAHIKYDKQKTKRIRLKCFRWIPI